MGYLETGTAQGTDKNIMEYVGPEIPDMGIVINRGATAVKPDFAGINRFKGLQFPSQGIVKGKGHL
jgi:hypothetical protein